MLAEQAPIDEFLDAHGRFFGVRPRLGPAGACGRPSFTFPVLRDPHGLYADMIGDLSIFGGKPRVLEHLRALGYGWDEAGVLVTVPEPPSLEATLADLGFGPAGLTPRYLAHDLPDLPRAAWFGAVVEGIQPVGIGTRRFYRALFGPEIMMRAVARIRPAHRALTQHLFYVHHDMSRHVSVMHLVPTESMTAFRRRIREVAGERYARWTGARRALFGPPPPICTFFENDLTNYCHRMWARVDRPEDFRPAFLDRGAHGRLLAVFEQRLQDSLRLIPRGAGKYRPPFDDLHAAARREVP